MEFLYMLFSSSGFMPHGHCYLWNPQLVWLNVVSDSLITLAYMSISITLVYFIRKRRDVPFNWMFVCFGAFILACGTSHLMEVWTLWHATYWLSGAVKLITALSSVPTAILLVRLLPKALALPSPEALSVEISERNRAFEVVAAHEDRLQIDLAAARELQEFLLPPEPQFPGIEIAALNRPATSVSGDLYEFLAFAPGLLRVFVGDVSGKGTAAALYAVLASSVLREAASVDRSPAEVLAMANVALAARGPARRYMAGVLVDWYPAESRVVISSAGAPSPLLLRRGRVERLQVEGFPIGLIPGAQYEETVLLLEPGDLLVLASDGVLECADASGREYGYERLAETIAASPRLPSRNLIRVVAQSIQDYAGQNRLEDDQTLVVLKVVKVVKEGERFLKPLESLALAPYSLDKAWV
jgi:serine phosphatase RsbU (regulator of sigma subunit)